MLKRLKFKLKFSEIERNSKNSLWINIWQQDQATSMSRTDVDDSCCFLLPEEVMLD
jgi:hypothetical protein